MDITMCTFLITSVPGHFECILNIYVIRSLFFVKLDSGSCNQISLQPKLCIVEEIDMGLKQTEITTTLDYYHS